MLPTACEPSINKLSADCTDATVALFKRADASATEGRGREGPRDLAWQPASIEPQLSIDQSALNLEMKAFLTVELPVARREQGTEERFWPRLFSPFSGSCERFFSFLMDVS